MVVVSVIVPSFNRPISIVNTIDSILSQVTEFDFEIIIGDDASNDNTKEVLLKIKERHPDIVSLFFNETNQGLGANWAKCVEKCKGRYIANCDDDDYWHNLNKLQMQVEYMEMHPEVGVLHTNYRTHNKLTGKIIEHKAFIDDKVKSTQEALFSSAFKICNATMLYRKDLIVKYINLNDYKKYHFTLQDWNTWVILAKFTKFYCLQVSTATFGVESVSITRPDSFEKLQNRMYKEKECYKYVCSLFPNELVFNSYEYDIYIYKVLLNMSFKRRDYLKAKKLAEKIPNCKKLVFTRNILVFYIYCLLKNFKSFLVS